MANVSEQIFNGSLASDPVWSFVPIFTILTSTLTVLFNGAALAVFCFNPNLRSPFAIYLMTLLLFNLLYSIFEQGLDVVNNLYPVWPLSHAACSFYLYAYAVIGAMPMQCHALITINRFWAARWPISYKTRHTTKMAVTICCTVWASVNALALPGLILDRLYYFYPLETTPCVVNMSAQPTLSAILEFVLYILPQVIVIVTFPYIWHQHKRQTCRRIYSTAASGSSKPAPVSRSTDKSPPAKRRSERRLRPFLVLALLTGSIFICWTPQQVFFAVFVFIDLSAYTTISQVCLALYNLQAVLDPILFTVALGDLRRAFVKAYQRITGHYFGFCT